VSISRVQAYVLRRRTDRPKGEDHAPPRRFPRPQRRRLRSVLRQLRTEVGFTQDHVAAEIGTGSLSKVIRIETGAGLSRCPSTTFGPAQPSTSVVDKAPAVRRNHRSSPRVARQAAPGGMRTANHYSAGFLSYLDPRGPRAAAGAEVLPAGHSSPGLLQTEDYRAGRDLRATAFRRRRRTTASTSDVEVRLHRPAHHLRPAQPLHKLTWCSTRPAPCVASSAGPGHHGGHRLKPPSPDAAPTCPMWALRLLAVQRARGGRHPTGQFHHPGVRRTRRTSRRSNLGGVWRTPRCCVAEQPGSATPYVQLFRPSPRRRPSTRTARSRSS